MYSSLRTAITCSIPCLNANLNLSARELEVLLILKGVRRGQAEEEGQDRRVGTIVHSILLLSDLTTSHMGDKRSPIQGILVVYGSLNPHIRCLPLFPTWKEKCFPPSLHGRSCIQSRFQVIGCMLDK